MIIIIYVFNRFYYKYSKIKFIKIRQNIFILNWLLKVHKCKCANIKEWYMVLIAINIISVITYIFNILIAFISFVMIVRLLIYINKLKKNNCDCRMTTQENIIYYFYF